MAFDLSTPVAKLAFEMALRNQQAIESGPQFDAEARTAVSKALKYGNETLPPFDDVYRSYVDPAEAQRRAQAEAFNAYLVGLPELLAQSQKEMARSSGSGGGSAMTGNLSGYESATDRFNRIMAGILGGSVQKPATQQQTSSTRSPYGTEERRVINKTLSARRI